MKRKALLFPVHMIPPSAKAGAFNPGAAEAAPPHLVVTESEDALRFGSHDASSKLPCVNHVDHLVAQGSTGLRNMLSKRVLRMLQRLAAASQQPRRWCRSGSGGGA